MTQTAQLYSVYLSPHAVELRKIDDIDGSYADLVCGQAKYPNALNFALRLARSRNLPLNNFTADHLKPRLEVGDGVDG
ncbi:MAG TPA: hypothetical protein VLS96_12815 [Nodosilinea sp.]|nr:hypothetical protein [Nodosilinea sp.]